MIASRWRNSPVGASSSSWADGNGNEPLNNVRNFPLWREIIKNAQCGLCVDPLGPEAIAQAIDYLHDHPEEARRMGENGRRAVLEKYNWSIEEQKLVAFYQKLLQGGR